MIGDIKITYGCNRCNYKSIRDISTNTKICSVSVIKVKYFNY